MNEYFPMTLKHESFLNKARFKLAQPQKAKSQISRADDGIVTIVMKTKLLKAHFSM